MTTLFKVDHVFQLRARHLFVIAGSILDGLLARGQHVVHPVGIQASVEGVESVYGIPPDGHSSLALMFRYEDEAQLNRWIALGLGGATLRLEGEGEGAQCPFKSGDQVVYSPSLRGRGHVLHTEYAALEPGAVYRVARVEGGAYVVVEGLESDPAGGLYWTEFTAHAG